MHSKLPSLQMFKISKAHLHQFGSVKDPVCLVHVIDCRACCVELTERISTRPQRQQEHKNVGHNCYIIQGLDASAIRYFDQDAMVGLILGTGSNACYVERTERISALPEGQHGPEMIVNVEWGNFDGDALLQTQIDRDIDDITPNAGQQAFEKQISGELAGHSLSCCW